MSEERTSNKELWEYREEMRDYALNSSGIRAFHFTEHLPKTCLVFEAGRTIMPFFRWGD